MHNRIRTYSGNRSVDLLAIRQFALDEIGPGINGIPMAFTQIIENGNFMPVIQQQLGTNASYVAGTANDKDFHWRKEWLVISPKSKATADERCRSRAPA